MTTRRVAWAAAVSVLVAVLGWAQVDSARAADSVLLPFAGGQTARVIQGYSGGTHQGRSRFAVDLVLAGGGTSGAQVLAPIGGSVAWAQAPGSGSGCMAVAAADGSFSVVLCHVLFDHVYRSRESIALGQSLGTVGPPGTVANNGTAHVHLELHRGRQGNDPVPFAGPNGLPLEGADLPPTGSVAGRSLVSSNGSGNPGGNQTPAQPPRPTATARATAVPTATAAPRAAAAEPPTSAPSASTEARPAQTAANVFPRAAVVEGTAACLKVRDKPGLDAATVDCLPEGTEVRLGSDEALTDSITWRQLPGQGWAAADFLRRTRAVINGTDSCLNVRDLPSTVGAVLTCLPEGTSVAVGEAASSELGDWRRVDGGSKDTAGWVLAGFLN